MVAAPGVGVVVKGMGGLGVSRSGTEDPLTGFSVDCTTDTRLASVLSPGGGTGAKELLLSWLGRALVLGATSNTKKRVT